MFLIKLSSFSLSSVCRERQKKKNKKKKQGMLPVQVISQRVLTSNFLTLGFTNFSTVQLSKSKQTSNATKYEPKHPLLGFFFLCFYLQFNSYYTSVRININYHVNNCGHFYGCYLMSYFSQPVVRIFAAVSSTVAPVCLFLQSLCSKPVYFAPRWLV